MSKEEDVIEALALLGIMVNAIERDVESLKTGLKIESGAQKPRPLATESRRRFRSLIQSLKYDEGLEREE